MKKKTTEQYKGDLKANNINIVCLEEYINNSTKILHKCLVCGNTWKVRPYSVLNGSGCPYCSGKIKKTTEQYKEELKDRSIEVLEEYINAHTKILHKCNICGNTWKATPHDILRGTSCPTCFGTPKKTTEQYKTELKSINSNIEVLEEYKSNKTKILHKCKICGYEWKVIPSSILLRASCPACSGNKQKTTEEYKEELKSKNPNIICLEEYINNHTKILHKCLVCGNTWKITPRNALIGVGCPKCNFSHGERNIENFLLENKISFIPQKRFSDCKDKKPLPFDFYLPEKNIAIEYQGIQHYKPVKAFGGEEQLHLQRHHDWLKRKYCKSNNITLITISYKENVKNVLKTLL